MSFYRDVYLKSDEWKSLRNEKIAIVRGHCQLCRKIPDAPDVHHVKYKRIFNVTHLDLRVLCRECHDFVHALQKRYPKLKSMSPKKNWKTIIAHFRSLQKRLKRERFQPIEIRFGELKAELFKDGLICRRRMVARSDFLGVLKKNPRIDKLQFLDLYIQTTNQDPRRLIPDVRRETGIPSL